MQKEIKKRARWYAVAAVLLAITLGSLCYNLGYIPQIQPFQTVSPLKTFSSYAEIKDFLTTNSKNPGVFYFSGPWDRSAGYFVNVLTPLDVLAEGAGSANVEWSTTNVQVTGVDEADTVKTDGEYLYVLKGNSVHILKAYPPEEAQSVSTMAFNGTYPGGIFVSGNRLVVLGSEYATNASNFEWPPADVQTFAYVYNISDRTSPELLRTFTVSGSYFGSRMIGQYVYFVASQPAYIVLDKVIIPDVYSNGIAEEIPPSEIHYSNTSDNYYLFSTFAALNMQNTAEEPTYMTLMVGSTSNMYVSLNNIYVTFREQYATTSIYRIRMRDNNLTCEAQGEVPGFELNQFSMDEYNDYFRIATTTSGYWRGGLVAPIGTNWTQTSGVYVLDMNLSIVGRLENLAPNENFHSARFMGDKCYLVTFKKVDPLFVIDLSKPAEPKVLGELKIPGYSDYLHPYDETHIIGVGKETVEADEGYFAWYQGIKISIFDVSDVNSPTQIANCTIGDRGSDTPVLYDHKAFLFDRSKNLLVIPVLVAQVNETEFPTGVQKNAYGTPVWQGAYVFHVTLTDGFVLRGGITHAQNDTVLPDTEHYVQRSLYIGDVLYTLSNTEVKMNSLEDLRLLNEIELP
jgi:inhibitor of cysteine peptidase